MGVNPKIMAVKTSCFRFIIDKVKQVSVGVSSPPGLRFRVVLVWLFLVLNAPAQDWNHFGFFWDQFGLTLAEGSRTEAAGPFYYRSTEGKQETWAIPPLFSLMRDSELDHLEQDFAYPLLTYDRYGKQYRWQFFQLLSFAGGPTQTEPERHRFTLFPAYFQQRSSDTNENYTALVPFYGHLKHRMMRDEIFFVMFPFYAQTRKRDVVTDNYLYPFYHQRHGDGLKGWQLWPFYGTEHKEVTWRTNMWGDLETVGGHDQNFVMWPFFIDSRSDLGTEHPQHQQALLPFYSIVRSPNRDVSTVMWPFFSRVDDYEKRYREWQVPFPLIVFAKGEGKTTQRVWPFFSQSHNATLQSDFYLWPVYKYNRVHADPLDRERTRIFFFLYSDTIQRNTQTKKFQRRVDFWPFYTHQRDYNGNTRLQILAPVEPVFPTNHKIARDYSPLWSLWRSERNPQTGADSQSLLWNLYRRQTCPGKKQVSLLFGLYQYQKTDSGKKVRLFFIPVSGKKTEAQK